MVGSAVNRTTSHRGRGGLSRVARWVHLYSAALVLVSMVFFAVTGFFLNHPELEPGEVERQQRVLTLPEWSRGPWPEDGPGAAVAIRLLQWLDTEHRISGVDFAVEYDPDDALLVFDLSGPGGGTVVEAYLEVGEAEVDTRRLTTLATLNNLHRAKHVTGFWRYLSDFSAVCMLVFCLSGAWLMLFNRQQRVPAVAVTAAGFGVAAFAVLALH